jgi:hypothetical protein
MMTSLGNGKPQLSATMRKKTAARPYVATRLLRVIVNVFVLDLMG